MGTSFLAHCVFGGQTKQRAFAIAGEEVAKIA
jgi:hypothetical protein